VGANGDGSECAYKADIGVIVASVEQRTIQVYQLLFPSQVDGRPSPSALSKLPKKSVVLAGAEFGMFLYIGTCWSRIDLRCKK
jgi:hypothetical protein